MISNKLNVSKSTYAGWKNNIDSISLIKLNRFCNLYGISLNYMCVLSDNKVNKYNINNIDMISVGNKLKRIRLKYNDTQKTTVKVIDIDQSNHSRYELRKIQLHHKICKISYCTK